MLKIHVEKISGVRTKYFSQKCCCYPVAKSCLTLYDLLDCGMPGSSAFYCLPHESSNSCLLSWWHSLTISSSVAPFSFCLQSFWASKSFPVSRLFASGGQRSGASDSAAVLPMNIQGWFPSELTSLISLQLQGTLKSLLQHHNSKALILQHSAFFMA